MSFSNPFLNGLLGGVLAFFLLLWWAWYWDHDNLFQHKVLVGLVILSSALLGFKFGEPFCVS